MRFFLSLTLACFLMACGSDPANTSSGPGSGGNNTGGSSSMAGGSGGTGGVTSGNMAGGTGGVPEIEIGPPAECSGNASLAPIDGEAADENGTDIHENGALACRRFVPSSYPFHVNRWIVSWASKFCDGAPSAVYFVQSAAVEFPIDDIGIFPGAHFTESAIDPDGPEDVETAINLTLSDGQAFYGCLRLSVTAEGRSCAGACSNPNTDNPSPDALYSNTNAAGTVTPLPTIDLESLSVAPTPAAADAFGNAALDWNSWIFGN